MNKARWIAMMLMLCWALACAGCGGGGGTPDDGSTGPAPNVTGWWLESWDDRDDPEGIRPFQLIELVDHGTTVEYGTQFLLQKDDRALSCDDPGPTAPNRRCWRYTIESSSRIEGLAERYHGDVLDWAHLRRLTPAAMPDGTLVVSGRVEGVEAGIDATHAYALERIHGSGQIGIEINDPDQPEYTVLSMTGWGLPPIPPGTYDVGYDPGELQLYVRQGPGTGVADTGSVTLTTSTRDEVIGWYAVEQRDGAPLLGNFNAKVRVIVD